MPVVGLVRAPSGLVMMAMAPLSARVSNTRELRATLMLGAVMVTAGYGLSPAPDVRRLAPRPGQPL